MEIGMGLGGGGGLVFTRIRTSMDLSRGKELGLGRDGLRLLRGDDLFQ